MTRAFQKHIARRQEQTFGGWFPELKKLAGESWADVADQALDRAQVDRSRRGHEWRDLVESVR